MFTLLLPIPLVSVFKPHRHRRRHHHRPPKLPPLPSPKPIHAYLSLHDYHHPSPLFHPPLPLKTPTLVAFAGRKKKPSPSGRIEGGAEIRRQAKAAARRRSRRVAQNLFLRKYGPNANNPDRFSEEDLQMIGLGYDRSVRFMAQDDPRLRHPHDWFKYGQYGPYSWRGVVVGSPIRGRFSDERVTLISEVRDHEEWEKIEQFEMSSECSERLAEMNRDVGFRYFWVFVRHPRWSSDEAPWQQWTLVAEVALEAGKQRLDKWNLMARLGNKTRAMVTQCAAWFRPDIIYVKRPVYQCRFEPQEDFFRLLGPLLDPDTENQYLFELERDDGRTEHCTYFAGLCKILRIGQRAYVDDVVNAYEKLSDEGKWKCLHFLLGNHPLELLHPWTKEWKTKLEELELGCDAPDDSDDDVDDGDENRITDWVEDDDSGSGDEDDDYDDDDESEVVDVGGNEDEEELEMEDNDGDQPKEPEETPEYWKEMWKKAVRNPEEMEKLVTKSMELSTRMYKNEMMQEQEMEEVGEEKSMRRAKVVPEQSGVGWKTPGWKTPATPRRRVKKSRIPPELFLRAAVRPFTYQNLVKEIVLTRHAIIDGDIGAKTPKSSA